MTNDAVTTAAADAPIIAVENVSKRFFVRGREPEEFRERMAARLHWGRAGRDAAAKREFWALKNVSFAIAPGQTVGIVGHNGSGKSTMLKMLTGILAPTSGSVRVRGRVGALIEVGAGFHPDLSGRENVYLNGSILGLTRREIDDRFDRIVEFAGLSAFIDTPVKRYSSGMYMRLGFSIAAHTDPDILLIDEVLAVGDTLFQRKCIRYLHEFVAGGGAAVFVSHSMGQVAELCQTCVWLDHGGMRFVGPTEAAIEQYMAVVTERENAELRQTHPDEWAALEAERATAEQERRRIEEEEAQAKRAETFRIRDENQSCLLGASLHGLDGRRRDVCDVGQPVEVRIRYQFAETPRQPVFALEFHRADGLYCFGTSNFDHGVSFAGIPERGEVVLRIGMMSLNAGEYRVRLRLFMDSTLPGWDADPVDVVEEAAHFRVEAGAFGHGCVYVPTQWHLTDNALPVPAILSAVSKGIEGSDTAKQELAK